MGVQRPEFQREGGCGGRAAHGGLSRLLRRAARVTAICLTLLLSGCQADQPVATPTAVSTATPAAHTTAPAAQDAGARPAVTITGRVKAISGGRLITLSEPAEGLDRVALTEETRIISAEGSAMAAEDLRPGMIVRASGPPDDGVVQATHLTVVRDSQDAQGLER